MEQLSKRLFNWASLLDPQTLEQAKRTSEMPFIFPHLALMPDAHLRKGEHPSAYKPIDVVMADAADLVDVRHELRQIVNVKGD